MQPNDYPSFPFVPLHATKHVVEIYLGYANRDFLTLARSINMPTLPQEFLDGYFQRNEVHVLSHQNIRFPGD